MIYTVINMNISAQFHAEACNLSAKPLEVSV